MYKLGLEKAEELEIKLPTFVGSQKKQEISRKKQTDRQTNKKICFIYYTKAFDCVDHSKMWENSKEMGLPDHLTCFLSNLYAGQEATIRT